VTAIPYTHALYADLARRTVTNSAGQVLDRPPLPNWDRFIAHPRNIAYGDTTFVVTLLDDGAAASNTIADDDLVLAFSDPDDPDASSFLASSSASTVSGNVVTFSCDTAQSNMDTFLGNAHGKPVLMTITDAANAAGPAIQCLCNMWSTGDRGGEVNSSSTQIRLQDGTLAAPALAWDSAPDTGIYWDSDNSRPVWVFGGVEIAHMTATGWTLSQPITLPAAPTADLHAATKKYVDDNGGGAVDVNRLIIAYRAAAGTDGGDATSGARRALPLNNVIVDTIAGASLSSNQITLPAGTYRVRAVSTFYRTNHTRIYLEDVDSPTTLVESLSMFVRDQDFVNLAIPLDGRFTLAAEKTIELQYETQKTVTGNGLGTETSSNLTVAPDYEIYRTIEITEE